MENQALDVKKVFKTIGFALFIMVLVIMVVQFVMARLLTQLVPGIEQNSWYIELIFGIPFYCVGFPIFLWIMKKIPDGPKDKPKKMSVSNIFVMFLISMAAAYVFNIAGAINGETIDRCS